MIYDKDEIANLIHKLAETIYLDLLDKKELMAEIDKGPRELADYVSRHATLSKTLSICFMHKFLEDLENDIDSMLKNLECSEEEENEEMCMKSGECH